MNIINSSNFFKQNARPESPRPSAEYRLTFAISQREQQGDRESRTVGYRPSWTKDEDRIFTNAVEYLNADNHHITSDLVLELIDSYFSDWDRNRRAMKAFIRSYKKVSKHHQTTSVVDVARLDELAVVEETLMVENEFNQLPDADREQLRQSHEKEISDLRKALDEVLDRNAVLEQRRGEHERQLENQLNRLMSRLSEETKIRNLQQQQRQIEDEIRKVRENSLLVEIGDALESNGEERVLYHIMQGGTMQYHQLEEGNHFSNNSNNNLPVLMNGVAAAANGNDEKGKEDDEEEECDERRSVKRQKR